MSVTLGYGDKDGPNASGVYVVGDNPVIDVTMPAAPAEGFLWVIIADVSGNLFNVLPNINSPDDAIAKIGALADDVRTIRVAYSIKESTADPKRLSFTVDETFGKSLIVVLRDRPTLVRPAPADHRDDQVLRRRPARPSEGAGRSRCLSVATRLIDSQK